MRSASRLPRKEIHMSETITTARLTLRRVIASDWPALRRIWLSEQNGPYARYDAPVDTSEEAVRARAAKWAAMAERDDHRFYAVLLEDIMIGYVAMNARPNGYETGYCFDSAYHGHGYAREALCAVIDSLRPEAPITISAGTALANTPSIALLKSTGFTQIGTETVSFREGESFEGGVYELKL